jgi:prephenate dehydrogenase
VSLSQESPDVYFEIQADNPHALGAVERLGQAVSRIAEAVRGQDREGFRRLMRGGSHSGGETGA